ncbi:MAG: thioredoxin family protein [Sulfurospirillaceae bacterium]|nr:thioredoxin family protein [Sulfurospirillaceae bacterium]MDD3463496.1 thioredoxin family protein [Sulfurospirillaceae bacterium]
MALVYSKDIELGDKLECFSLENPLGEVFDSSSLMGKNGLIVAVMCNHCPYANAIWKRLEKLSVFAKKVDVNTVAINPNIHPNYPEDSPAHMLDKIKELGLGFPYLIDSEQEVVRSLKATCTPDLFLFDADGKLYYHGRIDDNWRDEKNVNNEELREAIMLLFGKQEPPKIQHPSMGCSIKWIDTVTG